MLCNIKQIIVLHHNLALKWKNTFLIIGKRPIVEEIIIFPADVRF
jgi:hypothetical protein